MAGRIPEGSASKAELSAEVADLVVTVARQIRHTANHELGPLGVTSSQVRALRALHRRSAPSRMSELADDLRIARRSATSVVDELVAAGLVERSADPDDRRGVAVTITARGVSLLADIVERRREAARTLTASLTRDDLRSLRDLLVRMQGASDNDRGRRHVSHGVTWGTQAT